MQEVNSSFNIQAPEIDFENAQLFAEAGPMGLSLSVLGADHDFQAIVVYPFVTGLSEKETAAKFGEIGNTEPLLKKQYNKTHLFWAFTESILVPAELMNGERNQHMLNLVFGDAIQGMIRSDFLYKHNLHNVYRIPQQVMNVFSVCLPLATQTHIFSAMVNKELPAGNHLFTVFYNHCLTIMLVKEGKLQVIQNFNFIQADDCVFHLLNICKSFEVAPDTVTLHINGMIDKNSGLYDTVYKYFLHIELDALPEGYSYNQLMKDHPPHFFSHLFALASCV